MKHLATIQTEFLKEARKWDDLSYEEQKGYLSRHPKTKRRLTARPEQASVQKSQSKELIGKQAIFDLHTDKVRADFTAEDFGIDQQTFQKLFDHQGQKATVEAIEVDNGKVATSYYNISFGDGFKANAISGSYLTAVEPETQLVESKKSGPVKQKLPEKLKERKLFPADAIKSSLESLNLGGERYDSDERERVHVQKNHKGEVKYLEVDFRHLGTWHSRPGEEDDDYPRWDEGSEKKYTKIFESWARSKPWFDEDTMKTYVRTDEKAYVSFGIKKRMEPEKKEAIKNYYTNLVDEVRKIIDNIKPFNMRDMYPRMQEISSKLGENRELMSQKKTLEDDYKMILDKSNNFYTVKAAEGGLNKFIIDESRLKNIKEEIDNS